jgi:hypothetical protein
MIHCRANNSPKRPIAAVIAAPDGPPVDAACRARSISPAPRLALTGGAGRDLLSGRQVRLSEHSYRLPLLHFLVHPPSLDSNAPVIAFRDWLLAEAASS